MSFLLSIVAEVAAAERAAGAETEAPAVDLPGSLGGAPWFDAETNQIRPIPVQPRRDDSINRNSRWRPKPKTLRQPDKPAAAPGATGGGTGAGLFGTDFTLGNLFGWALLVALVLALVGAIVYAVSRAELKLPTGSQSNDSGGTASELPDDETLERIKHLPPELRRTDVNLRSECERLMTEAQFDQAIILLLGHQLLLLDQNGLLRLARGKTNGRYVRDTRAHDPRCSDWLKATTDAFEHSYFGRHEIEAEVFEELWRQNRDLESAAIAFGGVQ